MSRKTIDRDELLPLLRGCVDFQISDRGVVPLRLSSRTLQFSPDPALTMMARMGSGVRLCASTDTQTLELEVEETGLQMLPDPRLPAVYDLYVDGGFHSRILATAGPTVVTTPLDPRAAPRTEPGEPSTLHFGELPAGNKNVEIWLPQSAVTRIRALRIDPGAHIGPVKDTPRHWVHHGSSISHAMEAESGAMTWPAVAARTSGWQLTNLGFGGQCQLDGFTARTIAGLPADLISLKLGINVVNGDTMRERVFRSAVMNFLDIIREAQPRTPILIISPIMCPVAEQHPGPTLRTASAFTVAERPAALRTGALTLERIRQILEATVEARRNAGDDQLNYLDGLKLFGEADLHLLPDGLHPDAEGQVLMGRRFVDLYLSQLMQQRQEASA